MSDFKIKNGLEAQQSEEPHKLQAKSAKAFQHTPTGAPKRAPVSSMLLPTPCSLSTADFRSGVWQGCTDKDRVPDGKASGYRARCEDELFPEDRSRGPCRPTAGAGAQRESVCCCGPETAVYGPVFPLVTLRLRWRS